MKSVRVDPGRRTARAEPGLTLGEFDLHPVGPGLGEAVAWPLEQAPAVLRFYDGFARGCPDELNVNAGSAPGPTGGRCSAWRWRGSARSRPASER